MGKQPRPWLWAEASGFLVAVAIVDLVTPWRFSMVGIYCAVVFVIALNVPFFSALIFAGVTTFITIVVECDSIPVRGLDGYAWASLNRLFAILFATGCGASLRKLKEEMRQRMDALEHARKLERELIEVGEREQMRIGQDLHDGVCQTLAALDCAAQCLKLDLATDSSPRVAIAGEIQRGLSEATLEVRNMARGIYPVWRQGETIMTALDALVKRMNMLCRASISFYSQGVANLDNPEVAMHLYRITQEALHNALRHSNATQISLEIIGTDDELRILIRDDGCGSSIQPSPDGLGWRTMRYRARLIGAQLHVHSVRAGGTTVCCAVPLHSQHDATGVGALAVENP